MPIGPASAATPATDGRGGLRGIALGQIQGQNTRYLIYKELMVSLLNVWGCGAA